MAKRKMTIKENNKKENVKKEKDELHFYIVMIFISDNRSKQTNLDDRENKIFFNVYITLIFICYQCFSLLLR